MSKAVLYAGLAAVCGIGMFTGHEIIAGWALVALILAAIA